MIIIERERERGRERIGETVKEVPDWGERFHGL
jgi:hypothetical protein